MPLIGFKKQFALLVEEGIKRQTIRAKRRDGRNPHAGEKLYLYAGLRTKQCRKLMEARCVSVDEIVVTITGICLSGKWLIKEEAIKIAWAEGVKTYEEFFRVCEKNHLLMVGTERGLGFWGLLIKW